MSKVLVAYATGSGCTAGVAERIGETLRRAGTDADVVPVDSQPDPAAYDAVVVGSGVRAGAWHPRANKWVARNAEALKRRPVAFFTVGTAPTHNPDGFDELRGYTDKLVAKTGVPPLAIGTFAGWFVLEKFSWMERVIMRIAKTPEGDHRDWAAIEEWTAEVAPKLQAATA